MALNYFDQWKNFENLLIFFLSFDFKILCSFSTYYRGHNPLHTLSVYSKENAAAIFELFRQTMPSYPFDALDSTESTGWYLEYMFSFHLYNYYLFLFRPDGFLSQIFELRLCFLCCVYFCMFCGFLYLYSNFIYVIVDRSMFAAG